MKAKKYLIAALLIVFVIPVLAQTNVSPTTKVDNFDTADVTKLKEFETAILNSLGQGIRTDFYLLVPASNDIIVKGSDTSKHYETVITNWHLFSGDQLNAKPFNLILVPKGDTRPSNTKYYFYFNYSYGASPTPSLAGTTNIVLNPIDRLDLQIDPKTCVNCVVYISGYTISK